MVSLLNRALLRLTLVASCAVGTPLRLAAQDQGGPSSETAKLYEACARGDLAGVQRLLARGGSPTRETLEECLYRAGERGSATVVKYTLTHGADVNRPGVFGFTLLMHAASMWGHLPVVEVLLAHGAAVNAQVSGGQMEGTTALMGASSAGHAGIVQALLASRANVNLKQRNGMTALMEAAGTGRTEVVRLLLAGGADTTARTVSGKTALIFAERGGYHDIVRLLRARLVGEGPAKSSPPASQAHLSGLVKDAANQMLKQLAADDGPFLYTVLSDRKAAIVKAIDDVRHAGREKLAVAELGSLMLIPCRQSGPQGLYRGTEAEVTSWRKTDAALCATAALALGELGAAAEQHLPTLLELKNHPDSLVRSDAATAAGKIAAATKR